MKSIVRLKLCVFSVCLAFFVPCCYTEPFFSSKANITRVKLFHISPRNTSTITRKDDSAFGLRAKISRVVPIKHVPKMGHSNFKNTSTPVIKTGSNVKAAQKNPSMRMGNVPLIQGHFKSPMKNRSTNLEKSTTTTTANPPTSIRTTFPPNSNKSANRNPLFLTSDSWNYLNSAVTDDELRQIINGLSNEVIKNVSDLSKHDPIAGQNYLLQSIISEVRNLKRSRMLALDSEKKVPTVNKGVRFSAKQRKPVLNVTPLEQKVNLGKPVKNLIKTGVVGQWNISGVISNDEKSTKKPILMDTARNPELEKYANSSLSAFKASPMYPGSTTPSLLQVLAVPDQKKFDSTTFSPSYSKQANHGFAPLIPISNLVTTSSTTTPHIYEDKTISTTQDSLEKSKRIIEDDDTIMSTARKPRVPPKEEEYLLPPITTTSTVLPEANKGYQTITESTTEGPRVIWYHHNQTPQDTFYPNANNFLVPPEESSIEILTDLLPLQPVHDDKSFNSEKSFSPASSEINFKYDSRSGKEKTNKKGKPLMHYGSIEENGDIGTRSGVSRLSIEKDNKKRNKIVALQQAATSDHDGIREYYEDLDGKNGGSSGEIAYNHYHKKKRYGHESYNGYTNNIKHHEIIPRHHKTNRKPPPHSEDDTESYGAFNEDDHYHSSYPPPPDFTRHEIGIERYRSNHLESTGDNDYYKQDPFRTYVSSNGRFRDEGPTTGLDIYFKKEPSYRPKESSPAALGPYNGGNGNHGNDHGHHGWKDPSKDFFSKAKDYLKNSDFSTAEKWFDVTIGVLAFLAFGGYIIMLLYQVFAVSSGSSIGTLLGRSMRGAGEMFDLFFSKGPIGQAYLDELEMIVKKAMANVKRIWMTNSFAEKSSPKVKGEVDAK